MIELRWLTRDSGGRTIGVDANGNYREDLPIPERVLQFRTWQSKHHDGGNRIASGWSDWREVPEVAE